MTIRTAIYVRSSADCPTPAALQVECLHAVAAKHGWVVARVFTDHPVPIKRGHERRPGEIALLNAIRSGSVNRMLIVSLARLGESLGRLVELLEACCAAGVELYIHDRGIDTATSNGLTLFDLASMMAQHARQSRRDRILRGQAAARHANVRFGRPPLAAAKVQKAKRELTAGKGVRAAARSAGISPTSVSRLKNSMNAAVISP